MLSRIPFVPAALTAAALAGSLGLGGCSTNTAGVVTHTPALQTVGGRNTARSAVQSSLLIAMTTNGIALPGGPTPTGVLRRFAALVDARRSAGRRAAATGSSTGVCTNGVKQSQTTDSNNQQITTTDYYYDAACATLEAEDVITIATPATPTNTTGTGTITVYSSAGAVRVFEQLGMTVTSTTATSNTPSTETYQLTDDASPTSGATATAHVGATCVGQPNSPTLNCSIAHVGTSAGTTFGESLSTAATAAASGSTNNTATTNLAFYAGPGLGISQSGTTWGVTNATSSYNTGTTTFTYTASGFTGSGTMTMTESLYTYTMTVNLTASGLSASIIENPNSAVTTQTNIATATTDQTGTGTLSYADGTSETIAGGLIGF
jgi:hypothetical protein